MDKQENTNLKKNNQVKNILIVFLSFFAFLLLVTTTASVAFNIKYYSEINNSGSTQNKNITTVSPVVSEENIDIARIYQDSSKSVVGIGIEDNNLDDEGNVIGTGFVITSDGYIGTNNHVVSDENATYFVRFADSSKVVTVDKVFRDSVNDIAILKINEMDLTPLKLGDSDGLTPGEVVIAIGNPLGDLYTTITSGIVSGLDRTVDIGSGSFLRTQTTTFEDTIQTDAAINPGNSGGPLLNSAGEVIGINFATVADANNLSFAIPISYLQSRLTELQETGKFKIPYLGISYSTGSFQFEGDVFVGARVQSVDLSGGAANILEEGDVITKFNGTSLNDDSLLRLIQRSEIGDKVEVEFIRNKKVQTAKVEIVERKSDT